MQDDQPFRWEHLDQRLIAPKISTIAQKMHKRSAEGERRIAHETALSGNAAEYLPRLFAFHEQLADDWAAAAYAAHCDAWQQQGRTVSPGFIRAVRDGTIIPLIATRKGTVQWGLSLRAIRIKQPLNPDALGEWSRKMDRLMSSWSSKLEAEAVAAEYRCSSKASVTDQPELEDLLNLADGFKSPGDPVGSNPFSADNPEYQVWEDATRRAEQEVCLINGAGIDVARDFRPSTFDEARRLVISRVSYLASAKYDIWAKRGMQIVWSDQAIHAYDQWLANYANAWLNTVKNWRPEMEELLPELRSRLIARMEFWKSEARRYVSEQKAALAARANTNRLPDLKGLKGRDRPRTAADFWHSEDYRTIEFRGKTYHLSYNQAAIVRVLNEARERGICEVGKNEVQTKAKCGKISDSFRTGDGPKVWKTLIVTVSRTQGIYKLNLTCPK